MSKRQEMFATALAVLLIFFGLVAAGWLAVQMWQDAVQAEEKAKAETQLLFDVLEAKLLETPKVVVEPITAKVVTFADLGLSPSEVVALINTPPQDGEGKAAKYYLCSLLSNELNTAGPIGCYYEEQ